MSRAKSERLGTIDPTAFSDAERSLRELAYEQLLKLLLSGNLPAGSPLQERRLAEALKISRTPVREALRQLESEGLVMRQLGRLTTVPQISAQAYVELLNIRKLLEVEAVGMAAERIDKRTAAKLRKAVLELIENSDASQEAHWHVDEMIHFTIAEATGSPALASMIRDLRRRTRVLNSYSMPIRRRDGALEHLALVDAMAVGDAAKAKRLMSEHIERVKDSIAKQGNIANLGPH